LYQTTFPWATVALYSIHLFQTFFGSDDLTQNHV
jgi:hypothetical protein